MVLGVTLILSYVTADSPSLTLTEFGAEYVLNRLLVFKMAKARTVAKSSNSVRLCCGSKTVSTSAVLAALALIVIDLGNLVLLAADLYCVCIVLVDSAERTYVCALSALIANASLENGSFLDLSVCEDHVESLTGAELGREEKTVKSDLTETASYCCIVEIGIYFRSGTAICNGNAAGTKLRGVGNIGQASQPLSSRNLTRS